MNKLNDAETAVKRATRRKNAGIDVNGHLAFIGLLVALTGFQYLATEQLPRELRDVVIVRAVFEAVSLAYVAGGFGIIVGLGLRLAAVERLALLVLTVGLIVHVGLQLLLPAIQVEVIQVTLVVALVLANLGRLRVLRMIR